MMFSSFTLVRIWNLAVNAYILAIFVYVVLSWFPLSGGLFSLYRWLAAICEPYIGLFRRVLPTAWMGRTGMDFSPMVAWLVLVVIRWIGSAILALVPF